MTPTQIRQPELLAALRRRVARKRTWWRQVMTGVDAIGRYIEELQRSGRQASHITTAMERDVR